MYITKRKQLYERYLKEQQTLGQGDETLPYHQISEEERFEILQVRTREIEFHLHYYYLD